MTLVVGRSTPRTDGAVKVRGEAIYGIDYTEPGMLYAALLRSPLPAGRITKLDASRAMQMAGVRGVYTAADAPPVLGGLVIRDQPLFAVDQVRYEGEPIAAVVADSLKQARAAVKNIDLEIAPIEIVPDIKAALADDAPCVHPDWERYELAIDADHRRKGNVMAEMVYDPGGVDAAFDAADLIVENEFVAPRQYHACMEPKSALGRYEDGRYIVHTATQFPFNVRDRVAQFLGTPVARVRIVNHHIGGGFGAKLDAGLEPYAALLAQKSGRPVKLVDSRQEDLLTCPSRENAIVRIRSGVTRGGEIVARELICLMDGGAYATDSPFMTSIPLHIAGSVYRVGTARVIGRAVYTNSAPTGAMRGVSGLYLYFALERHMDCIAAEIGMDRREFRLRNLFRDGDRMLNGQVLQDAGILREAFDAIDRVAPWKEITSKRPLRGVGLGAVVWLTNPLPGSATLKVNEDGTVGLITAATDNGTGAITMGLVQIVAEELGVSPQDVVVPMPDTDMAGYDAGSQGSRTTHIVGRAIRHAAAEVREKIFETAAKMLEAAKEDLEIVDGMVGVAGGPGFRIPLAQVAQAAMFTTGPILGTGSYTTPTPAFNPTCASGLLFPAFPTPTYHVHLAEVEVDPITGRVTVLRYVVAQEVGKVINPLGVMGQIQGGVAQGLGYALYENIQIDEGRYRQRSLESYRLPVAPDVPRVETILLEHPDAQGPYGAKGVAEPPIVPVPAAIGNAVADAIGRPINRLPITPDDVLAALADSREPMVHQQTVVEERRV
jgi:CO/xanthine dehydrogenase Mo-binding subunit